MARKALGGSKLIVVRLMAERTTGCKSLLLAWNYWGSRCSENHWTEEGLSKKLHNTCSPVLRKACVMISLMGNWTQLQEAMRPLLRCAIRELKTILQWTISQPACYVCKDIVEEERAGHKSRLALWKLAIQKRFRVISEEWGLLNVTIRCNELAEC